MIALITATGGRPQQIRLCAEFMHKQTYQGKVLWILVDDVIPITIDSIPDNFREGWTIIKGYPEHKWKPGMNTQASNLLSGIDVLRLHVRDLTQIEAIFIIEDDDYYSSEYLSVMMTKLQGFDVAGQQNTVYYNPITRGWMRNGNYRHASLFQVAFTIKVLQNFKSTCAMGRKFIDMNFFRSVQKEKVNLFNGKDLAIGIKGLPGRAGIGMGHRMDVRLTPDPKFDKLKELIGEDYKYYE